MDSYDKIIGQVDWTIASVTSPLYLESVNRWLRGYFGEYRGGLSGGTSGSSRGAPWSANNTSGSSGVEHRGGLWSTVEHCEDTSGSCQGAPWSCVRSAMGALGGLMEMCWISNYNYVVAFFMSWMSVGDVGVSAMD